jgi:hypothetical protein
MGKQTNHSGRYCGGLKHQSWFSVCSVLYEEDFLPVKKSIGAMQNWLKTESRNFFSDGIKKKLSKRWNHYVEVERDYVE